MRWWVHQVARNYSRYQDHYIHQGIWKIEKERLKGKISFPWVNSEYQDHYVEPGRWRKKKDVEKWMVDYHPEPGYPNISKNEKLKELKLEKQNGTTK